MHVSYSLLTTASPENVWKIWTDVKKWKDWTGFIKDANLEGTFRDNAHGIFTPDGGRKTSFRIINCKPNFTCTIASKLPFAQVYIRHLLGYNNQKTIIKEELWIEGPLSGFWWQLLGKRYGNFLPKIAEKVKQLAESARS